MKIVIVIASTYKQALLACEQKDLPPPGRKKDDVVVVAICSTHDIPRIHGTIPERVIVAQPTLNGAHRWKQDAIDVASMRLSRSGDVKRIEWVRT